MSQTTKNKLLYTFLWGVKKPKSHTFWYSWKKISEIIPKKDPKLLDMGCGIRPRVPIKGSYFLDLSKPALDIIEKYGGKCTVGDARKLPFKSNFFDFVNATELIEHIKEDDKVFSEVRRVLKKGAYFSFSVPLGMKYWSSFDAFVHHVRRYEPRDLYNKVHDNGLKLRWFLLNNPSKSKLYKGLKTFLITHIPHFALFLEEHVALHIGEKIQHIRKPKWHADDFIKRTKNSGGVIMICQKV
jgi:SAM-dependent methyltransferase